LEAAWASGLALHVVSTTKKRSKQRHTTVHYSVIRPTDEEGGCTELTQDVAEIYVEKTTRLRQQKVVQMAIPDSKEVGDHAVTSCESNGKWTRERVIKERLPD
jgi:hypothetical protein